MHSIKKVFFVGSTQCCFAHQATARSTDVQHESMVSLGVQQGESQSASEAEAARVKKLVLMVQDSPSLQPGKCFVVTSEEAPQQTRQTTEGKTATGTESSTCDIVLTAGDTDLGAMHFAVEYYKAGEYFRLKSLGDSSSAFLRIDEPRPLHNGDLLSFGLSHAGVQITSQESGPTLALRFFEGPCASEVHTFNTESVKIGRMADCTVIIDDINLSRYQCMIRRIQGDWVISDGDGDRKSANGTWCCVCRLCIDQDFRLANGMVIRAGRTLFAVSIEQNAHESGPQRNQALQ